MRIPFFYGWIVAVYAAVVAFSSGPGQSYVFSVFLDSIIEETGFSRTMVSALYALGTVVSAGLVVVVSRLADRYGPTRVLAVAGTALALACFGMAFGRGMVMFILLFAALRALGQGSLPINGTLLAARWFVRYRGRAVAVMGLGFAASTSLLPPLSRALIDSFGWREAYGVLGVLVFVLVVPAALLFIRDTPEEMGLHPDGADRPPVEPKVAGNGGSADFPVLTSPTFWMISIPLSTGPFVMTALVFHQTGIFEDRGLSASVAAGVFVPFAIASATASMASGVLVDMFGPRRVFALGMGLLLLALGLVLVVNSPGLAIAYGAMLGAAGGSGQIISGVTWAHFYGRQGLGRLQGSAMMVNISAAALAPLPLAALYQAFGDFTVAIAVMVPLPILSLLMMWLARPGAPRATVVARS